MTEVVNGGVSEPVRMDEAGEHSVLWEDLMQQAVQQQLTEFVPLRDALIGEVYGSETAIEDSTVQLVKEVTAVDYDPMAGHFVRAIEIANSKGERKKKIVEVGFGEMAGLLTRMKSVFDSRSA